MDSHTLAPSVRVLKGLALVVAVIIAFLAGVLVERLRFDSRRTDMLRRYEQALRQHQQQLMQSEKQSPTEIAPTHTH
jgi:type II secretory pathway pseudopilin PulG